MVYNHFSMLAILACVCISMANLLHPAFASQAILGLEVPFAVELVIRFIVCPNRPVFWFDVYNLMDFLAIFASFLPRLIAILVLNSEGELAYACQIFSPFLFMLRLLRRFEHFQLLTSAFGVAAQALPVLLYTLLLIALFSAGVIYLVEPRDVVPTLQDSLWFTVVTMATVGYGDISPITLGGRAITVVLIILSSLYTAIPIGIVGNAFAQCWNDRERLLLMEQLRRRIARAGYTPQDLLRMFRALDMDGDGQLSFEEFLEFLPMMKINKSQEVAYRVFETYDDDGQGTVDFREFLMGAFPAQRYYMSTITSTTPAA